MDSNNELDGIIVSLPFSTLINTPPLGAMVLKSHAKQAGFEIKVLDLNIRYIKHFFNINNSKKNKHEWNNNHFTLAFQHLKSSLNMPNISASRIPCCRDILLSFPLTFAETHQVIANLQKNTWWIDFFAENIFNKYNWVPVLGISIMGPNEIPIALLLSQLCRKYWPKTTIIAGGTHITLMENRIINDKQYGDWFDYFLPRHSEEVFVKFLQAKIKNKNLPKTGILQAGNDNYIPCCDISMANRLPPLFEIDELKQYPNNNLLFPIQLRRGCSYGKCRYCTFPVVEKFDGNIPITYAANKQIKAIAHLSPKRISIRDSLIDIDSLIEVGKVIKKLLPQTIWRASSKVNSNFTIEKTQLLYDLNLRSIEFGIETIHPHIQKLANKIQPMKVINKALNATLAAKIKTTTNLIFGFPGEKLAEAKQQLEWFLKWKRQYPNLIYSTMNMLGLDDGSIFSNMAELYGIKLDPIAPWAYNYVWNAPAWRKDFCNEINIPENLMTNPLLADELLFI